MTDKEIQAKILKILLSVESGTKFCFNEAVRKIQRLIRKDFTQTNNKDVWRSNKRLKSRIEQVLQETTGNIVTLSETQIKAIWGLSEGINDSRVKEQLLAAAGATILASNFYKYFNRPYKGKSGKTVKITTEQVDNILTSARNDEALETFLQKKYKGLTLSDRVWRIMDNEVLPQIESALAEGVKSGKSAEKIARGLKKYLNNPDALFRRVKNKNGKLKLSVAAKKYTPGQGVYRSARMNALRLATTTVNEAYRMADCERWQQLDFVLGYRVRRSKSNKGACDICDPLTGDYPKSFLFTGWHPFCICFATPILQNKEEFINDLNDNANTAAKSQIKDIPASSRAYFEKKIKDGKLTLNSYHLKNNKQFFTKKESK